MKNGFWRGCGYPCVRSGQGRRLHTRYHKGEIPSESQLSYQIRTIIQKVLFPSQHIIHHIYIYIYTYRERERDIDISVCVYIYIYIYIVYIYIYIYIYMSLPGEPVPPGGQRGRRQHLHRGGFRDDDSNKPTPKTPSVYIAISGYHCYIRYILLYPL